MPCAPHRDGIDVDGKQLDPLQGGDQGGPHSARAAAQVDGDSSWLARAFPTCDRRGEGGGLADEEFAAATRDEDSGLHNYP